MLADGHEETLYSLSTKAPARPERREASRQLTVFRVGTLTVEGRRELCMIRNISVGGMKAHVYSCFHEGQEVTADVGDGFPHKGIVTWTDDTNVGISFDEPLDVEDLLASPTNHKTGLRSRAPRVEIDRLGVVRFGAETYGVNTHDISQGGIKLEVDHPLIVGSDVVLSLEKFRPIAGVVRWYADNRCGISFNQPIPFAELINWLRA